MIRAYPNRPAIVQGEPLRLHVSTDASRFCVHLYRWGAAARIVGREERWLRGRSALPRDAAVPWQWPCHEIALSDTMPHGVYIALLETDPPQKPVRPDRNGATPDARSARALFVLRDRSPTSKLLVVLPLLTYHAYNVADVDPTRGSEQGSCLYSGASTVSLHRPGGGIGGHPWDQRNEDAYDRATPRQTFAHWDAKAIAWLESAGYTYDCCTDLELHDGHVDLSKYRAVVSFGHHEYFSSEMRDRIDAFVEGGGNVGFFGGNTCWFRVAIAEDNCSFRRAGRWVDPPEWTSTGVSYAYGGGKWIGTRPPSGYRVRNADHWLFEGAGLRTGEVFGDRERLIGYECDGAPAQSDLEVAADASLADWDVSDGSGEVFPTARVSLGVRGKKGTVFTASTADWARVLAAGEPRVTRITQNVLNRFLR